jgi:RNA 3'-terminal phosphate cyclase (ATP)
VIHADGPVTLEVNGGTDVKWSPTLDYFKEVFLPAASLFGVQASLTLSRRGYYPRGGGQAELVVRPGKLNPAKIVDSSSCQVLGRSHCSNLPSHVPTRQASAAASILKVAGCEVEISTDVRELPSTGSGITLWSGHKGASALGERGVRAENVGRKAAEDMVRELSSPAAVDIHLADQLIPYLAMAGGSYTVREVSEHARTNIWTVNHFFEKEIKISGQEIFRIEAQPESN